MEDFTVFNPITFSYQFLGTPDPTYSSHGREVGYQLKMYLFQEVEGRLWVQGECGLHSQKYGLKTLCRYGDSDSTIL